MGFESGDVETHRIQRVSVLGSLGMWSGTPKRGWLSVDFLVVA